MQKKKNESRKNSRIPQVKFKWDKWQEEVLEHEGNITIRAGRQVGKSEVISSKACKFAIENPGTSTMIIAASQRQSSLLFEKVRANFDLKERKDGKNIYAEKPTLTKIILSNGSKIYSLPAGRTGYFIRGFTVDLLIADEAAYIPEEVWKAVIPMIAVSRQTRGWGWLILLSTPFGKGGYFYDSHLDTDFRQFHVSSEKCLRIPAEFLTKERKRLSKMEYAQEYLGEFIDDYRQFFPTKLIKKCMTFMVWEKAKDHVASAKFYLGVDFARYGGDENAFVIAELYKNKIKIVKVATTKRVSTTDTIFKIHEFHKAWKFSKIFVDDGGLGGAILDILQDKLGKRRVIGLNNASKRFEMQGDEKRRGILKEDLYSNTLTLMENGHLDLINDLSMLRSLKSITYEYGDSKYSRRIKIFGLDSHITEALVRACWCIKEKGLNLFIY